MEEMFSRGWTELLARDSGPLHIRLFLQPLVAMFFAVRSGVKDARAGQRVFFWAVVLDASQRRALVRQLWKDVGKLFLVAAAFDVVYQAIVLRFVYPVQALIVATVLAILPYLLFRGVANRLARRSGIGKYPTPSESDGGPGRG